MGRAVVAARGHRHAQARARRVRRGLRLDAVRILAGCLAISCVAALAGFVESPSFVIRDVGVSGTHHVAVDAVTSVAALDGMPLFTASAARARERVLRLPAVHEAHITLALPDRARIAIEERDALGRWIAGGQEWFVDAEGVVFGSLDARAAPEARVTDERGPLVAGTRLDPALVNAAIQLSRLRAEDLRPDATSLRVLLSTGPNGLVLRNAASWEIRFGEPDRIADKIALARRFLRENPQRKLDYVDVRSADSIVYSPR